MGRSATHPIRKLQSFDEEMVAAIGSYRAIAGISTEAEAVRRLIQLGLEARREAAHYLSADTLDTVDRWRQQHVALLTIEEAIELLLRRGMAAASTAPKRPDARPIQLREPPPPAAEAIRLDERTEDRLEQLPPRSGRA